MVIGNLPHVKYVATLDLPRLPCNLSLMVCFGDINVSQGSVATYARYGWIFNTSLTTNLPRNLSVTYCLNRLRFDLAFFSALAPCRLYCKFTRESSSEKNWQSIQIWQNYSYEFWGIVFSAHPVSVLRVSISTISNNQLLQVDICVGIRHTTTLSIGRPTLVYLDNRNRIWNRCFSPNPSVNKNYW